LGAANNTATTEDDYLAVIRAKTAELFAAACEVGPALAGRPKDEQAACRSFGMNLGIAFQLVDDTLDYGGKAAKLGKNVGDDFRAGKITLPVVLSFRRGAESERVFWRRTLENGEATDADLELAITLMTKHRARRIEQPKTGCGRSRHAHESTGWKRTQRRQHTGNHGLQRNCRRLKIISICFDRRKETRHPEVPGEAGPRRMAASPPAATLRGSLRSHLRVTVKRFEHILRRHRYAGVDQNSAKPRQVEGLGENV